jgi:hypothetical protein
MLRFSFSGLLSSRAVGASVALLAFAAGCRSEGKTEYVVDADQDGVAEADDCDDNDAQIGAGSTFYTDADGDGYGDGALMGTYCGAAEGLSESSDDCDDADSTVHPDADDLCDGIDQDCDGVVDNDSPPVAVYSDADGDGYGDDATATLECVVPEGAVTVGGDCNDADFAYNPDATEDDCADPNDYNCDGSVGFADSDADGFAACADCDDGDGAVNPDAAEVCNGFDDDCDALIDVADDSLDPATETTVYADADSDSYGDSATATLVCTVPEGSVTRGEDCDDTDGAYNPGATEGDCTDPNDYNCDGSVGYADADGDSFAACEDCDDGREDVYPGADEYCDEADNDCDGSTDEDALDVTPWYADADADTFGDPAVSLDECAAPAGYVADDTDCDDSDSAIYPGATEVNDGVDNNCDGTLDDTPWAGTGADGALDVTGTTVLGEAAAVTGIGGATLTLATTLTLSAGDEVLVINMHGADSAYTHVGNYEFLTVASSTGTTVTVTAAPSVTFGEVDNTDLSDQDVQIVRVPQYTDVTIGSSGVLTAPVWDGSTGGVLAFRASGTVSIASGGMITVDEAGYAAGATGTAYNADAYQGESYAGTGDGNEDSHTGVYGNVTYGYNFNNYGGGGAMITGGGGNYGGGATAGDEWTGGSYGETYTEAYAGETYGSADLSTLFLGSGGAGVWNGLSDPGPGGDGAGILYIGAVTITATDASAISAIGGTTTHWATGSWTYGAGGGAGGSIWLQANTLTLPADGVNASGGYGESTHIRAGGDGGYGRVRVDFNTLNGQSWGGAPAVSALQSVCAPDAGSSSTP